MTLAHVEIVRIVRRRHLHRAGTKRRIDVLVGKEGNLPVDDGENQHPPHHAPVTLVVGVNGHARIAKHRLRARRGDLHVVLTIGELVAQMPELPALRLMLYLNVRKRRMAAGAPIRNACPLVDQPFLIKAHEDLAHRSAAPLVHGKPLPLPIAGRAEGTELGHDAAAELLLPRPDPLQKLFPPQIIARQALFPQGLLHLRLGGDARVIAPRHPERIVALHTAPANENILQRIVHGVSHVELPRHIGRRNDDAVRRLLRLCLRMKEPVFLPIRIPFLFKRLRIIHLRHILFLLRHLHCLPSKTNAMHQKAKTSQKQQNSPAPKDERALLPWYHLTSRAFPRLTA